MTARLVSEEGDLKGLVLTLDKAQKDWIIGRDPDEAQLVIADSQVSRRHARATLTPEGIYIENLSHTNPILINEEEVDKPYLLRHGDALKIGDNLFRYYTDSEAHVIDQESPSEIDSDTLEIAGQSDEPIEESSEESSDTQEPPFSETKEDEDQVEDNVDDFVAADTENETIEEKEPQPQTQSFDTLLQDSDEFPALAEIDFGLTESGRWLLKVVGGPNNGAEFYMETGNSYILGTDPVNADIIFHDTSVSRQHAKITISPEDEISIEDLKSSNGVVIDGKQVNEPQFLTSNSMVTLGTSSFIIYDREGEMHTIISPLLPSIVKMMQEDREKEEKKEEESDAENKSEIEQKPDETPAPPAKSYENYVFIAILAGLFLLVGLGTVFLFKSEPVTLAVEENANEQIQEALVPYPAVRFSFNPTNGSLILFGHVLTAADKNHLAYSLYPLRFIKSIDQSEIVIDEGVWREINSVLSKNPAWQGVSIHSVTPGEFILSGYLTTRKQAELLTDSLSINFPYPDLLKKEIVVEEDVLNEINRKLNTAQLSDVKPKMTNGEVALTGTLLPDETAALAALVEQFKKINGVRSISNFVKVKSLEQAVIDLSGQYQVTGQTKIGDRYTVIINGRILSDGDQLDGMTISSITNDQVNLQKGTIKYKISY